jgi:hypothetical protein
MSFRPGANEQARIGDGSVWHRGVDAMTAEEQATLATLCANVEMRVRDLLDFPTAWTRGGHS